MPQINFQYPILLWTLAAVPLLVLAYGWHVWRRRRAVRRMGDKKLVQQILATSAPGRQLLQFVLALTAFVLGCLALANPRHPEKGTIDVRKGIDIMLALDVSNSMLADEGNATRLEAAHNLMRQFVQMQPDDRIGLVLFAGSAYVQMPLTFDRGAADLFISTATPESVKSQGTAIFEALKQAAASFDEESERYQTVVLITDGETHDEGALDQAKELAERGISIHTIGIGSVTGTSIIDPVLGIPRRDAAGNAIVSKLNEDLLQQLAQLTNGQYQHLGTDTRAVAENLATRLSQMEKKALGDTSQFTYISLYPWFVVPMALLLLLQVFIPTRKKVKA